MYMYVYTYVFYSRAYLPINSLEVVGSICKGSGDEKQEPIDRVLEKAGWSIQQDEASIMNSIPTIDFKHI